MRYHTTVLQLLATANVPSSPILFTLMMEVIRFSETLIQVKKGVSKSF
jgi:hypothetical protein